MKGKRIFTVIFTILLFLGSFIIIDQYDDVKENVANNLQLNYQLSDDILELAYDKASKMDKDFKIIEFKETTDKEKAEAIEELFRRIPLNYYSYLENDVNFKYTVINDKTNEKQSNYEELNPNSCNDNYICGEIIFSDTDIKDTSNEIDYGLIRNMNEYHKKSNYNLKTLLEEYNVDEEEVVAVNKPNNIRFIYNINCEFNEESRLSYALYNSYLYEGLVVGAACFSALLVALFMILYPIKYVKESNPFKFITNFKAEIVIVSLIFIGLGIIFTLNEFVAFSIGGQFASFINECGITKGVDIMIYFTNVIIWIGWFILVAVSTFYIKYILTFGIIRFIKEETIVGSVCVWLVTNINKLMTIDLNDKFKRNLIVFMMVNALILMIICLFRPFGILFVFIYIILLTIFLYKRYKEIVDDYQKLLSSTRKVASGNFDDIANEDVGIFKTMQLELNNIKDGFEKAVREETVSQSMKTELITNVSHDLKTPLTGIRNYVELLNDDSLDEEKRKEYLNLLDSYTDRLGNLIEDLFEVSKVNSGNIELELVNLDIISLIRQALAEKEDEFEKNNLEVVMPCEEKIELSLDSDKTYRVFDNLLTNISKYAMPYTRVYIDTIQKEDGVEIIFKNVSKSRMNFNSDEITERFVRGDKSRSEAGSGIGLAIVRSFLEAQGAQFKIDIDGDLFKAVIDFKY